jgi:hypothetical protein
MSLLCLASAGSAVATDFGQADLDKIVNELDKVIPHNANYKYPIKASIVDEDVLNAYATYTEEGTDKRATMVVYTGLIKKADGDPRLIRAVVAHELSHLSLGHSIDPKPAAADLQNLWIRQIEYAADKFGAESLVKAGYAKKDMSDMLLFLNAQRARRGDWLERLTADHADPKARAAEVSDNPDALKALVTFDTALAYEDARSHLYAHALFEAAAAQWPALTEAYINSGKCNLLYYYDNLPAAVRASWWRPDFGALITSPHAPLPQATEVTDQDREAWKDAMLSINNAVSKNPGNERADELLALGKVLEPDAKKDVVQEGIDWFLAHQSKTSDELEKLRYANNAGLGYQRLGDLSNAYHTIIAAQQNSTHFNVALGENMGLVVVKGRSKEDNVLAANVMYTWLSATPSNSPRWALVKKTFEGVCSEVGITPKEIEQKPAYLCSVVSLHTFDHDLGILLPVGFYKTSLGEPEHSIYFSDKYPDLTELSWKDGKVKAYTERNNIMRITSYEDGAYLLLKQVDSTSTADIKITVGMSKADLYKILDEKSGVEKPLANKGKSETWTYYPALNMGVFIEGDVVKAITVSPVIQA